MTQEPAAPRLFLIDGYALIYRAFFALISRPLTTSRGENTSAAWGIANFLQRLMRDRKPEYLAWVHDRGLSFRHETYPEYKATREKLTDELQADFNTGLERIRRILDAYGIPVIEMDGYEADDVIGALARKGVEQGLNVVIVSGDKDFYQLIRDHVWLLNPGRGGPAAVGESWVSTENASERLGVAPEHVTDYLALLGDTSDNVPGVPGIGEKTARELIGEYGSLEQILAHAADVKKKRPREALLANEDKARLSKELVTIRDDLAVELDLGKMKVGEPDVDRLRDILVELEFHNMARELGAPEEAAEVATTGSAGYEIVDSAAGVRDVVAKARKAGEFALHCMTVPEDRYGGRNDPLLSQLVSIAIALDTGKAYYFPLAHRKNQSAQTELLGDAEQQPKRRTKAAGGDSIAARLLEEDAGDVRNLPSVTSPELAPLRELLQDATVGKLAHDGKRDVLVLRRAGINLTGLRLDSMLASYVLDPGRRSHSLELLALEAFGHRMTGFDELVGRGRNAIAFDVVPTTAARDYACELADMTLRLAQTFRPQLEETGLQKLLDEIEMPLVGVLCEMEWTGITIDVQWFRSLKERFQRERGVIEEEIYRVAGGEFNINSPIQLREILFGKLELPVLKRTATGPSTDASVLQQFAEEGHRLPALILEYRELAKLENTYLDALPALVNPNTGRLHTSYAQAVASTGRLSSSDPNLQNIPIRRELGRFIRKGFIPRKGWKLMAVDYSQIELRLLAHMSDDPAFVRAFKSGGDVHRQTASVIFGVAVEDVTPEMRARAKTINFATIYGQGPRALSTQLGIDYSEARDFIDTYFERFKGVRDYLDSCVERAREQGYVQTIFGRRRFVPEIRDKNFNIRAFGERLAQNSPIQGSAADLIKIAMIRIEHELRSGGLQTRMLLQVHDELVFEVPADEVDAASELVRREMEGAAELKVPLVVDIGVGDNWLETKGG